MSSAAFSYDDDRHEYCDAHTGEVLPSITQMLKRFGLVDDRWYNDESRDRGSEVHRLTSDFDLGVLPPLDQVNSRHVAYVAAYVAAAAILRPTWSHIEEPMIHGEFRFGGRPDRVGLVYGAQAVLEIKSGGVESAHAVQTALQAILVAPELRLPAESLTRYALYVSKTGTFKLEQFMDRRDFNTARRVIRECCRVAA